MVLICWRSINYGILCFLLNLVRDCKWKICIESNVYVVIFQECGDGNSEGKTNSVKIFEQFNDEMS